MSPALPGLHADEELAYSMSVYSAPVMQVAGLPALGYLLTTAGLINNQDAEVSFGHVQVSFGRVRRACKLIAL